MSRLEELIQTLCPDGVEFLPLGKLCVSLPKGTLTQDKLNVTYKYPVINSGREYYGRYSEYNNDGNALVIASRGEYAGFVSYISEKFWAGGLCYPYRSKNENNAITKYIYYVLKNSEQKIMDSLVARGSIPALNKSDIDKFLIPLPPFRVQEEIVRILDTFTALETELENQLEAELAARTKQYEHYRNELLSFDSKSKIIEELLLDSHAKKFELLSINEVFRTITPPKKLTRDQYKEIGTIPIIDQGQNPIVGYTNDLDASLPKNSYVLFGDHTRIIKFVDFPFAQGADGLKILRPKSNKYLLKYLYYAFLNADVQSRGYSRHWTYARKIKISVPPLEVQEKIVSILDRFDALVNDLKSGLPAEIALRRKQYEYYRDKLLTFKPLE